MTASSSAESFFDFLPEESSTSIAQTLKKSKIEVNSLLAAACTFGLVRVGRGLLILSVG